MGEGGDVIVSSLISGGHGFLRGAAVIRESLRQSQFTCVLLAEDGAYSDRQLKWIESTGWTLNVVRPLRSLPAKFAAARWPRTFTKIHLWDLGHDKVLYMDADALPMADLSHMNLVEFDTLAATTVKTGSRRFRSGMMLMRPDRNTYAGILDCLKWPITDNGANLGDQGVLNRYFRDAGFTVLAGRYNECNWRVLRTNTVIAHIRPKPWERRTFSHGLAPVVEHWKRLESQSRKQFGDAPKS